MNLLPFQQTGVDWLAEHFRAILGDEMGLGKTVQVLGLVNTCPGIRRVLIVCPATLKLNWVREIEAWCPGRSAVVVSGTSSQEIPKADFTILNYDILKHRVQDLAKQYDLVVADEAHNLKNTEAGRTRAFFGHLIGGNRLLFLTGTPIPNRPKELWPLLHAIDPKTWKDRGRFEATYCGGHLGEHGWWADGATNLGELNTEIAPIMLRRLKKAVLPDLPELFHQVLELEGEAGQVSLDGWRGLLQAAEVLGDIPESEVSRLRRQEGVAKIPQVIEHLEGLFSAGKEKLVVFAYHRDVIQALADHFISAARIDGGTPSHLRDRQVKMFQENNRCNLFIGQIQAAGEGITLTAADHVVFAEIDWVPGRLAQAAMRCHRIGQKQNVLVQYLVTAGTFDAWMGKTIVRKMQNIGEALGDMRVSAVEELSKFFA